MRTLAELDNTRKRSIEENEKTAKYAISKFAEDLIPVMEDFYLAFNSIEGSNLLDEKVLRDIVNSKGASYKTPWYGQLMTGPQLLAYLIQVNIWLKEYNVNLLI